MDKYTIDLDQVLNDFEYSELTDQQSKNASEKPHGSTSFQPPPVTKHSINNVFHSLNEYLNSEISSSNDKAEFGEQNLEYDQKNLGKNDNNIANNVQESYSKVNEDSKKIDQIKSTLDTTRNILESFNNTVDILDNNERLLKLKNESEVGDILETIESDPEEVKDDETMQLDELQKITENLNLLIEETGHSQINLHPDLVELVDEGNPSNIINENFSDVQHNMLTENDPPPKKTSEDINKTEQKNFSLLDMENVESEIIPELNCTENNIKSELENVNNDDKECDKIIDNKADNKLNNEQINFVETESFFTVNECKAEGTEGNNLNSHDISAKENLLDEKTDIVDVNASDNVNNLKNEENYVIEPSESLYAMGKDSLPSKNSSSSEGTLVVSDNVVEYAETASKLEGTKEPHADSDDKRQINPSYTSEHINNDDTPEINKNVTLPIEKLTNNDAAIKKETVTNVLEENSETIKDQSENADQKILVGFTTDIDIDEGELNKMLEELEIEEKSGLNKGADKEDDLKKMEGTLTDNEEEINHKIVKVNDDNVGEGNVGVNQVDVGKTEPEFSSSDTREEVLLEETENSGKNLDKNKDSIDNQLIECLEIEKPSKNKGNSEKLKIKPIETPATLQEESDTIKGEIESADPPQKQTINQQVDAEDIDNNPTILHKQQSQDSLSRPQDLPLNNKLKDENVTRKIDLIGSPGSTPYNNVYINKSIEPKMAQDTDSDYTSSASPTFSDCSTDSTSTASTASIEDAPKNSDDATNISTKNTTGHKNRRSDKTAVKNRSSGEGVQGDLGESNVQENTADLGTEDATGLSNQDAINTRQNASDISNLGGGESQENTSQPTETFLDKSWLGKEAPLWIPDSDANSCLHCDMKFTVLKRRHHCRACGLVLCSKCCNLKFRLEYLNTEARVCTKCYNILNKDSANPAESGQNSLDSGDSTAFRPNPNNPLEYCSTVSPLQQMGATGAPPPSVMVPVGVLKRKGALKKSNKSVMFCDGIAPGSDLTNLDQDFNYNPETKTPKSPQKIPEEIKKKEEPPPVVPAVKTSRNQPKIDQDTGCFIPKSETSLPPTVCVNKTDILYSECSNSPSVVEMLKNEALTFAINSNLFVLVKVINMSCCINKQAWCFSTDGLINVGSDEIVYLIEYIDEESFVPKDVFFHINNVYLDAVKGTSIKEQGLSLHNTSNFLDSKNHAGFVYIRPTFQCLDNVLQPKEPYLIGILIHRWETPWAKLFPLRLILRLGAEYRYYPSPLISTRHRDSVFVEIGHTIINLLADFRNFTYTLPQIRGLIIHMEDKKTTITIPKNRYDQVMKSINNSSEHILAFAGNFSSEADSHLVCIQDTQGHENCYTTHAINIHNKPRKITGASFIVFNGSLKSSSGLTAKSNIVEDGLMIQIPSEHMDKVRDNLRNMKNHTIACGCINAVSDESVNIVWGENDTDFNVGVQSPVDLSDMKGVPSIRVHNGKDYFCNNGARLIRWTEVFILQSGEENPKNQDPVDISKVSESIAKACCTALVKYLDLLVSNSCQKIGIRATLHVENVAYSAGSNGLKLPPIYMKSLDNELIPVLHRITSNNLGDNAIVVELIFRILNA